jgi:glucose-6-phosphate dehydrogenase assembly protein OpcA
MAQAVADSRRTWSGRGVTLAEVLSRLTRMHADITRSEHEHEMAAEHPHPKNCVLNLVVSAGDGERARAAGTATEKVALGHPLRAIVLESVEEGEERIDAEITSDVHHLGGGAAVQRELIVLRVHGSVNRHIASLVEPLLVPDVRSYLWWAGSPELDQRNLREALAVCDRLIVDSRLFDRPAHSFLEFAGLASREEGVRGFSDLQWTRQRPWRESVAQFFAPDARRRFLSQVSRIEVVSSGLPPGQQTGAALLVGWIGSALGWRIQRASVISDSAGDALMAGPDDRLVQVAVRSRPGGRLASGELLALRLEGAGAGARFSLSIQRDPEDGDSARIDIAIGASETVSQRLALPDRAEDDLVIRTLVEDHNDTVFARSLRGAAQLVDALR